MFAYSFTSPLQSPIEVIPKSTLLVFILASGIPPPSEHEQSFSELQSIAEAVTAQHQGNILSSRLHPAILPLLLLLMTLFAPNSASRFEFQFDFTSVSVKWVIDCPRAWWCATARGTSASCAPTAPATCTTAASTCTPTWRVACQSISSILLSWSLHKRCPSRFLFPENYGHH